MKEGRNSKIHCPNDKGNVKKPRFKSIIEEKNEQYNEKIEYYQKKRYI